MLATYTPPHKNKPWPNHGKLDKLWGPFSAAPYGLYVNASTPGATPIWYKPTALNERVLTGWHWTPYNPERDHLNVVTRWYSVATVVVPEGGWQGQKPVQDNQDIIRQLHTAPPTASPLEHTLPVSPSPPLSVAWPDDPQLGCLRGPYLHNICRSGIYVNPSNPAIPIWYIPRHTDAEGNLSSWHWTPYSPTSPPQSYWEFPTTQCVVTVGPLFGKGVHPLDHKILQALRGSVRAARAGTVDLPDGTKAQLALNHEDIFVPTNASELIESRVFRLVTGNYQNRRPVVICLLGAPGTGKNEVVRHFARRVWRYYATKHGAATVTPFSQFFREHNCSSLTTKETISKFMGTTRGIEGGSGDLVRDLQRGAQMFFFDEIDKAHDSIIKACGGLFEDGKIVDNSGAEALCRPNTFFFLGANFSSLEQINLSQDISRMPGFVDALDQSEIDDPLVTQKLRRLRSLVFSESLAFIGDRCKYVVLTHLPDAPTYRSQIVTKFLHEAASSVPADRIHISWTPKTVQYYTDKWKAEGGSIRDCRNQISTDVESSTSPFLHADQKALLLLNPPVHRRTLLAQSIPFTPEMQRVLEAASPARATLGMEGGASLGSGAPPLAGGASPANQIGGGGGVNVTYIEQIVPTMAGSSGSGSAGSGSAGSGSAGSGSAGTGSVGSSSAGSSSGAAGKGSGGASQSDGANTNGTEVLQQSDTIAVFMLLCGIIIFSLFRHGHNWLGWISLIFLTAMAMQSKKK